MAPAAPPAASVVVDDLCALSSREVESALADQLAGAARAPGGLAVYVACPGPEQAAILVRRAGRPAARRDVALDDVAVDLRERVVALAIAETVRDASLAAPARSTWRRGALVETGGAPGRAPRLAVLARGQARLFTRGGAFLAGGEAALAVGPALIGVAASGGSSSDALGTLQPVVLDASLVLTVACLRGRAVEACAGLRGELGAALVTSRAELSSTVARSASGPYLQVGLEVGVAVPVGRAALTFDLGAGWAEGLVLLADRRTALELAGPVVELSVGGRLPP